MMTRVRKTAPKSETSFQRQHSQFASRPFAPRAEEHEAQVGKSRVSFSLADIDIFPRETVQPKRIHVVQQGQKQEASQVLPAIEEARPNRTGMPDGLKSNLETLSGMDLSGVRVHHNSFKPVQLNALAYTQGQEIHVAPGQDRHLPHEAWHVVQQMQGRVKLTTQMKNGVPVNDDEGLEQEADVMGANALAHEGWMHEAGTDLVSGQRAAALQLARSSDIHRSPSSPVVQAYSIKYGSLHNDCGTDMHVLIKGNGDPDLNKGCEPKIVPNWWPYAPGPVATYFSKYIVQGHLLNKDLGGPGDTMDNLTPISKSTNTTHFKKVEDAVKNEVLIKGNWVEYRVRANYSSSPTLAEIGNGAPPAAIPYLNRMAGEIGADYDVFDPLSRNKIGGLPGELLIKNEGPQKKGTY
jgi:hypothetical protein